MRNDVKLGFAIGGVLLAVLVVYVLVVPGSGTKNKVALNSGGKDDGGKVTLEPVAPAKPLPQAQPASAPPQTFSPGAAHSHDIIGSKAESEPAKTSTDPFASNTASEGAASSSQSAGDHHAGAKAPEVAKASTNGPDWNRILNDQPTLIAQTPVRVPAAADSSGPSIDAEPQKSASQSGSADEQSLTPTGHGISAPEPVAPKTAKPAPSGAGDLPSSGGATIHTVASGETFSSISASAYGSPNFYPAIMRANPSIDPQHLKPGMKITLPDASQVKPSAASSSGTGSVQLASAKAAQPIDPKKQYRVQPGDSLYRIAVRLYGKGAYSDKIFELNQQTMGGDETRLRPGQILQLPEPPTQGQ